MAATTELPAHLKNESERVKLLTAAYNRCLRATGIIAPGDVADTLIAVAKVRGVILIKAKAE